jgi:hypothetical protein
VKLADRIRLHGVKRYVIPAKRKGLVRFSIRTGEVVRELGVGTSRAPAVCSALKTNQFLRDNNLRLVDAQGPKSGQSTRVIYTYQFIDSCKPESKKSDIWEQLRGAYKDIFDELGGGEAYLRSERSNFYGPGRDR